MEKIKDSSISGTLADEEEVEYDNLCDLINSTDDLIWSVDRNCKLITSNRAFKEKVKQLSGETAKKESDVLSIYIRFMRFYERALGGERFIEIEYSDDPVPLWLEVSFSPIRKNNEVTGVACYAHDITTMKKKEHHLELLESVVTNATDSILVTEAVAPDRNHTIVYVNDALTKMTGYTQKELLGKTPRVLQGPKTDKAELARAVKCLEESAPCEFEIVNYKKNGEEFWMHLAIVPITNSTGLATHYISIGRDVTERFENIEAIKDQNKKLSDIAWVQSHNVRGPLARIKGLVDLLSNHSHSEDDTELIAYLIFAANEMDSIISEITKKTEQIYGFNRSETI